MTLRARQSRRMSLMESATNITIGYCVALLSQILVFPLMGIYISFHDNIIIGLIFTGISIGRSYLVRRLFERVFL